MDHLSNHRTPSDKFSTASLYEEANGKMFGVLVCRLENGQRGVLRAFSGEWEGRKTPAGWVPSSGFPSEYEAERDRTEAEVADFTQRIASLKKELPGTRALRRKIEELKIERGGLSRALTERIHDAYRFENALEKHCRLETWIREACGPPRAWATAVHPSWCSTPFARA